MAYLEGLLASWYQFLLNVGPTIGMILILLAGIIYGVAYFQPAEARGKWQKKSIDMALGGVIIIAIVGAVEIIKTIAMNLLT